MTDVISILLVLAGLAFILQVALERVKTIMPFLGGTYQVWKFSISPMQYISLACGIGLMFAINQPMSLFGALGYEVPEWVSYIVNGILVSGGSNYIYDLIHRIEKKDVNLISTESSEEN